MYTKQNKGKNMIVRNCSQILIELSELENQISKLEKELKINCPDLDLEETLQKTFDNQLKKIIL